MVLTLDEQWEIVASIYAASKQAKLTADEHKQLEEKVKRLAKHFNLKRKMVDSGEDKERNEEENN